MYKYIKGYEGLYAVNEHGNIKSYPRTFINNKGYKCTTKERLLLPQVRNGYLFIRLSKNSKKKCFSVHRLVAKYFLPNPNNKPFVNHIDGNKKNNNVKNLEWVTSNENMQHSYYILKKNKQPVLCIDTGISYPSMKEAERQTGIFTGNITHSCRLGTRAGGYLWKYIK